MSPVSRTDESAIEITVSNHGTETVFVLTEPSGGTVWVDSRKHEIVIAHYAYTWERENDLRGGWTVKESYRPKFHSVEKGQNVTLEWRIPQGGIVGRWQVTGKIAVHKSIVGLDQLEGSDLEHAMAARDIVVDCRGSVLVVE